LAIGTITQVGNTLTIPGGAMGGNWRCCLCNGRGYFHPNPIGGNRNDPQRYFGFQHIKLKLFWSRVKNRNIIIPAKHPINTVLVTELNGMMLN
jgi:hypothetical protein